MPKTLPFLGLIGSGLVGREPYDRRSFSGISYYFFSECKKQGLLGDAIGCEVEGFQKYLLLANSFHPSKPKWRMRFYQSKKYRDALTDALSRKIPINASSNSFLQIGCMFDAPSLKASSGYCVSYNDGNIAMRLRTAYGSKDINSKLAQEAIAFERSVSQRLDRIFVMGEFLAESFINDYDVDPSRIINIGHGANLDTTPEDNPSKNYSTPEILFIGVDFERKGGPQLLLAMNQLIKVMPHAKLHIVGPLHAPPSNIPLNGVVWHGFLRKEAPEEARKLNHLFEQCNIFILPSLYEPFGISVAEAMLHAMAPIVSGDWGLGEKVEPGISGLHVIPGDQSSIYEALLTLCTNSERMRAMGQAARARAIERFTWQSVVKKLCYHMNELQSHQPINTLPLPCA